MRVGFIGLGMMGKGMAANLQKAGHELVVHDLSACRPFIRFCAKGAPSGPFRQKQVAEQSEIVFTLTCRCRPMSSRWRSSKRADRGPAPGRRSLRHVDHLGDGRAQDPRRSSPRKTSICSTCPVSGGSLAVRRAARRMAIWVGGDEQIFNRHKRVLDAMGDQAAYIGPTRRRLDRQARAQLHQRGLGGGARRGLYDGRSRPGSSRWILWAAVRQGATGRQRTPDRKFSPVSVGQARPGRFRFAPPAQRCRGLRSGSGARSECRCGLPTSHYEELTEVQ